MYRDEFGYLSERASSLGLNFNYRIKIPVEGNENKENKIKNFCKWNRYKFKNKDNYYRVKKIGASFLKRD